MRNQRNPKRGVWVIVLAFLLVAVFLGALLFRKYEKATTPPSLPVSPQKSGLVTVTLFFAAEAGEGLARENRQIEPCDELQACLEAILEELINGPVSDLASVLPLTGMFNSVKLEGNTALVDFAQELLDGLPAGSSSELIAAYSVVNSLCFNYPQVQQVIFTVEGKPLETLKGHLDISKPISPDFFLEKGAKRPQVTKEKR